MIENLDTDRLLAGPLGEWLKTQEGVRAEAAATSNKRFMILAAIAIPIILIVFATLGFGFIAMLSIFISAGVGIWAYMPRANAIKAVKVGINQAIAQAVGIEYSEMGRVDDIYERCKAHSMLPSHNREKFEDFWTGEVEGHSFRLFEAHLQHESTDSEGRTKRVTKFRGPMLEIGFAREFHGTTLVTRDGAHRKFFIGRRKDTIKLDGKELGHAEMVNPEFEDVFDIYSDDQVEARYLVHPAYCEQLLAMERAFSGAKVRALFCGGMLTIVLESKELFESGGMDASKDREKLDKTLGQFRALANLAVTLNENAR